MPQSPWIALLKKIPTEFHCQLSVITRSGIEITVQLILDTDGECLAIRGRMSGSQDGGRVYFVPFDNIDYVGFNRMVGEEEYRTWFVQTPETNGTPAVNGTPAANGTPVANGTPAEANSVGGNNNGTGGNNSTFVKSVLPNRAALLDRIRARPSLPG